MNTSQPNGGMQAIYADYQATAPVDPRVLEQMAPYWRELFGNPHSSDHVVGWRSADAVSEAAASVASLVGSDPDEIIFTSGATEANNLDSFVERPVRDGPWSARVSGREAPRAVGC